MFLIVVQRNDWFRVVSLIRTDIKRRTVGYNDTLDTWLKDKDDLRFKMMSLAIKNKDFEMLTRLHAREIPLLYTINHFLTFNPREDKLPESKNIEQFTQSLASCSNTTLAYFFDSFTVESTIRDEKNTFIFPYAGAVLNQMIKRKEKSAARFIEKVTKWNKQILSQLKEAIDDSVAACKDYYAPLNCPDIYNEAFLRAEALRDYYFYPNTGFVAFTNARFSKKAAIRGFITNVPAPPAREQGIIAPRLGAIPILSISSSMNRYSPEPL